MLFCYPSFLYLFVSQLFVKNGYAVLLMCGFVDVLLCCYVFLLLFSFVAKLFVAGRWVWVGEMWRFL